jgi:hypothetical protein
VADVVVLVVAMQFLGDGAGADVHCYGDREQGVGGVRGGGGGHPVGSDYGEEVLSEGLDSCGNGV